MAKGEQMSKGRKRKIRKLAWRAIDWLYDWLDKGPAYVLTDHIVHILIYGINESTKE